MTNHTADTPERDTAARLAWLDTNLDGRPVRFWILIGLLITAAVIGLRRLVGVRLGPRHTGRQLDRGGRGGVHAVGDHDAVPVDRDEVRRFVEQEHAEVAEVLPEPEYAWAHIEGAVHLFLRYLSPELARRQLDPDGPVIVYCDHYRYRLSLGPRKAMAAPLTIQRD